MLELTDPQISETTHQRGQTHRLTERWQVIVGNLEVTSESMQPLSIWVGGEYFVAMPHTALTCSTAHAASLFHHLRKAWYEERGSTSSIVRMAMCPSYQRIVAMGPDAIPLILQQLEGEGDQPDMWFWALRVLTNADPVSEIERGDVVAMAASWLNWARGRYAW